MFEVLDCAEFVRVFQLGKNIKYIVCKKRKISVLLYKFRLFFTVKCKRCCYMLNREQKWDFYKKISLEQCT